MVTVFSGGTCHPHLLSVTKAVIEVGIAACVQWVAISLPLLADTRADLLLAGDAFSMIKSFLKVTRR